MTVDIKDFGLGTIFGIIITATINHIFNKQRDSENRLIKAYDTFHETFIPAILDLGQENRTHYEIIITEFPQHEGAFKIFIDKVDWHKRGYLDVKWEEYKKTYEVCKMIGPTMTLHRDGSFPLMFELDDLESEKQSKKETLALIEEILAIAKNIK